MYQSDFPEGHYLSGSVFIIEFCEFVIFTTLFNFRLAKFWIVNIQV